MIPTFARALIGAVLLLPLLGRTAADAAVLSSGTFIDHGNMRAGYIEAGRLGQSGR